jgi:hypothetical protein
MELVNQGLPALMEPVSKDRLLILMSKVDKIYPSLCSLRCFFELLLGMY